MENETQITPKPLTELPVPALNAAQLAAFTPESMHAEAGVHFDAERANALLAERVGNYAVGGDFGGDKGASSLFQVQSGWVNPVEGYRDEIQGNDGVGYVASLKKSAAYAEANNLPFGISWGGPVNGTKPLFHPKAAIFISELGIEFGGDLAAISPNVKAALNDGPAGLISAAVEAYKLYQSKTVLFVINGGGIGAGALIDNTIYALEPGHIAGVPELNTYQQTTPCGVYNAQHVCLERLGANKAGIEAQWEAQTGSYMRARDIEDRYKEGNQLAADLYDHSALVLAHIIQGSAHALNIDLSSPDVTVVAHGGAFKFPHYGERVIQILNQANGSAPNFIMTKDYGSKESNACLDGAVIAAVTA